MRRHKNLYGQIIAFNNLLKAAQLAQKGKRFKSSTAAFNFHLERELWTLHDDLSTKQYQPGAYCHFTIFEPKQRLISAAPYRDRVVHHALHHILEPIFEPTFIFDSYATRKGKGTHAAIERFQQFAETMPYVLKCDIQQYFPSINHAILIQLLKRKIACPDTLWLMERIVASHRQESADVSKAMGIPIGNLTSQFFANVYLNGLDHFIKERLGCRCYLRYMDDFVLFHHDKMFLWEAKAAIQEFLGALKLQLHADKCRIYRVKCGVPFLGFIMSTQQRRLQRANVIRAKRRLRRFQRLDQKDLIPWVKIRQSIQAWIGHARHADTWRLREFIFKDLVFRGKGV